MYRKAAIAACSVQSQDPILDPLYALYSTTAKLLYEGKMKVRRQIYVQSPCEFADMFTLAC